MTLEEFAQHVRPNERKRLLCIQGRKDKVMRRVSILPHQKGEYVEANIEVSPGNWQLQTINKSMCVQI